MNILMISVDSLRFDKVTVHFMPVVSELAEQGARFLNNFTVSNGSLPSHTSILTGLYPQHHGVRANGVKVPESVKMLPELLDHSSAGAVGCVLLDSFYGLGRGFHSYYNTSRLSRVQHILSKIGRGKYNVSKALVHFGIYDGRTRSYNDVNKDVIPWIENHDCFFMFVHYSDIHRDTFGGTKTIADKHRNYDENVKIADAAIGEIVSSLKKTNKFVDTLIVVFSDHGEMLDSSGHGKSVSDDEFHTPLIMHKPGLVPKTSVTALTRTIDIMPTILALLQKESATDGIDLSEAMDGGEGASEVFMEAYPPYGDIKAVRTSQWKFVLEDGTKEYLYDMAHDSEKVNIAEKNKSTAQRLKTKLKRHFKLPFNQQEMDELTKERLKGLGYLD